MFAVRVYAIKRTPTCCPYRCPLGVRTHENDTSNDITGGIFNGYVSQISPLLMVMASWAFEMQMQSEIRPAASAAREPFSSKQAFHTQHMRPGEGEAAVIPMRHQVLRRH